MWRGGETIIIHSHARVGTGLWGEGGGGGDHHSLSCLREGGREGELPKIFHHLGLGTWETDEPLNALSLNQHPDLYDTTTTSTSLTGQVRRGWGQHWTTNHTYVKTGGH